MSEIIGKHVNFENKGEQQKYCNGIEMPQGYIIDKILSQKNRTSDSTVVITKYLIEITKDFVNSNNVGKIVTIEPIQIKKICRKFSEANGHF